MRKLLFIMMAMVPMALWAQFAPPAGHVGTTAIHADSSAFVAWATGCTVERGPMRIDRPEAGLADFGHDTLAIGVPGGTFDVVSLGDGGVATLTFASPICNGVGPDFAVFENGFVNAQDPTVYFLELAFVEVSSDGMSFFRFPAISHVTELGANGCIDPEQIHNFAGKYEAFYVTPFDLDDVEDNPLLDKNHVTHVRLVDVVGCSDPQYATYDSEGHVVVESWPTPFGSSGFDLDAVGVIHDLAHNDLPENGSEGVALYPNPVNEMLIVTMEGLQSVEVYNAVGQLVVSTTDDTINMATLPDGVYFVRIVSVEGNVVKRVVKQ